MLYNNPEKKSTISVMHEGSYDDLPQQFRIGGDDMIKSHEYGQPCPAQVALRRVISETYSDLIPAVQDDRTVFYRRMPAKDGGTFLRKVAEIIHGDKFLRWIKRWDRKDKRRPAGFVTIKLTKSVYWGAPKYEVK